MPPPEQLPASDPRYDPAQTFDVKTYDVAYTQADGAPLLARIYEPQGPEPFPLLVDVHGGGWVGFDRTANAPMDQALAASGLVVAALDFRLAPTHPYPASMADINYGIRWLKAHARDFNADPAHAGGLGTSSGGHMIVLSAMRPRDPRYASLPLVEAPGVDAGLAFVVALWPIVDPYDRYCFAQETGRAELVTCTEQYFLTQEAMQEANPQWILERGEPAELPPILLLQGTADTNLRVSMIERFVASYRAVGGALEFEVFPEMPHGFGNRPGPESERALQHVQAFIARQLAASTRPN
jgi:acetyl esterase/lipase